MSPPRVLLFLVGSPTGLFWVPFFSLFMYFPLGKSCTDSLDFHCYADDILYVPLKPGTTDISHILFCLTEVKNWMSESFLQLDNLFSRLNVFSNNVCKEARNREAIFDLNLLFDTQVTKVTVLLRPTQLTKNSLFLSPFWFRKSQCFYFFQTWLL